MKTLHIHVDESGDLNFASRGSRFYIFTAAWTYHPIPLAVNLANLRYSYIKAGSGTTLSKFHASEDKQNHRNGVIDLILGDNSWRFASIVVEKRKVNPKIRDPKHFYPQFLGYLLCFVFRGNMRRSTTNVLVYTDSLPVGKRPQQETASSTILKICEAELNNLPFQLMHHTSDSNDWLQIVDYCSWAVCRKWEKGDYRTYDRLSARLQKAELDPMSKGRTIYY